LYFLFVCLIIKAMSRTWLVVIAITVAGAITGGVWYWHATQPERIQQKIQALVEAGRYEEAGELLRKFEIPEGVPVGIDTSLADAEALAAQGWVRLEQRDFQTAIQLFERARALSPGILSAVADGLALSYAFMGERQKAMAILNEAIQNKPNVPSHYEHRALLYADRGERLLARADLEKVLILDPNYPGRERVQELLNQL
jgi:tetratricopeptide (TPR) repeat protein